MSSDFVTYVADVFNAGFGGLTHVVNTILCGISGLVNVILGF